MGISPSLVGGDTEIEPIKKNKKWKKDESNTKTTRPKPRKQRQRGKRDDSKSKRLKDERRVRVLETHEIVGSNETEDEEEDEDENEDEEEDYEYENETSKRNTKQKRDRKVKRNRKNNRRSNRPTIRRNMSRNEVSSVERMNKNEPSIRSQELCCLHICKYSLITFNFIIWVLGVGMFISGIILKYNKTYIIVIAKYIPNLYAGPNFLIGMGVIVNLLGFTGCCGPFANNRFFVCTYAISLSCILITLVIGEVVLFSHSTALKNNINLIFRTALKNYNVNVTNEESVFLDYAQGQWSCCGCGNSQDYIKINMTVPKSCGNISTNGCCKKVLDYISAKEVIIIIFSIAVYAIIIFDILFATILYCFLSRLHLVKKLNNAMRMRRPEVSTKTMNILDLF